MDYIFLPHQKLVLFDCKHSPPSKRIQRFGPVDRSTLKTPPPTLHYQFHRIAVDTNGACTPSPSHLPTTSRTTRTCIDHLVPPPSPPATLANPSTTPITNPPNPFAYAQANLRIAVCKSSSKPGGRSSSGSSGSSVSISSRSTSEMATYCPLSGIDFPSSH